MKLLVIREESYVEAAREVTLERRRRGETNLEQAKIEKVIRAYVWAAQNKLIRDWTFAMPAAAHDTTIKEVMKVTKIRYGFQPAYDRTHRTLQLLEDLAQVGRVAPIIARARYFQEEYEKTLSAPPTVAQGIEKGIERFTGWIATGAGAVAKGIGVHPMILVGAAGLVAVLALRR